jgi:hypothetical protein
MNVKELRMGDFSRAPFGRKRSDGKFSGEKYREDVLIPALKEFELVQVLLDEGVVPGYEWGSSFLHEVFGKLVLTNAYTEVQLKEKLEIVTRFKDVDDEIWEYIHAPSEYIV